MDLCEDLDRAPKEPESPSPGNSGLSADFCRGEIKNRDAYRSPERKKKKLYRRNLPARSERKIRVECVERDWRRRGASQPGNNEAAGSRRFAAIFVNTFESVPVNNARFEGTPVLRAPRDRSVDLARSVQPRSRSRSAPVKYYPIVLIFFFRHPSIRLWRLWPGIDTRCSERAQKLRQMQNRARTSKKWELRRPLSPESFSRA